MTAVALDKGARDAPAPRPWLSFAVRRSVQLVVSLVVLLLAAFAMIHAVPGDPVRAALGLNAPASLVQARRHALGLDLSLPRQFVRFLQHVLHGDFGQSISNNISVHDVIAQRLPATLELASAAFVVTLLVAIPLGWAAAVLTRAGRRPVFELGFTSVTGLLGAIPEFLLAVALVYVFSVSTAWLPPAGRAGLCSYVLPVAALAIAPIALLSRIVRIEVLRVLDQDYVRTAHAKRLPAHRVYLRHALPNALTATLTVAGTVLTTLVAGTVLVENVFSWPGVGFAFVQAVAQKDYGLVQALVLVFGSLVLVVNLVVDVVLAVLDPQSAGVQR